MLGRQHQEIRKRGWSLVLIHMNPTAADHEALMDKVAPQLKQVPHIMDPDTSLYRAAALARGNPWKVMGPRIWWRGFLAVILRGHRPGKPSGDVMQLAGALFVRGDQIVARWQTADSADQPDVPALLDSLGPDPTC